MSVGKHLFLLTRNVVLTQAYAQRKGLSAKIATETLAKGIRGGQFLRPNRVVLCRVDDQVPAIVGIPGTRLDPLGAALHERRPWLRDCERLEYVLAQAALTCVSSASVMAMAFTSTGRLRQNASS